MDKVLTSLSARNAAGSTLPHVPPRMLEFSISDHYDTAYVN